MSDKVERVARAIYDVAPARVFVTPAGERSIWAATDETAALSWEYVRDNQWAIYFQCIDQAMAAMDVA